MRSEKIQDDRGYSAAVVMDLSKALEIINQDPLISKIHAYGLHGTSLILLRDYLSNRFQRTKINCI